MCHISPAIRQPSPGSVLRAVTSHWTHIWARAERVVRTGSSKSRLHSARNGCCMSRCWLTGRGVEPGREQAPSSSVVVASGTGVAK